MQRSGWMVLLTVSLMILAEACQPVLPVDTHAGTEVTSEASAESDLPPAVPPGPEWIVFDPANSPLPVTMVQDLALDPSGGVWIGTSAGLARFDGVEWDLFQSADTGLPSDNITAIAASGDGAVWVGTDSGLARYDGQDWQVFTSENSDLPYDSIHELVFDSDGRLWIGTGGFIVGGGGGLAAFDGVAWTTFSTANSELPSDTIVGLATDASDNLWIGTAMDGLVEFDGETWTRFTRVEEPARLREYTIPAISFDRDGSLWVATSGGAAMFDGATWSVFDSDSGLPIAAVEDLAVGPDGDAWLATRQGIAEYDGEAWTVLDSGNSGLPDDFVFTVVVDDRGNVWIGTADGGLAVYRDGGVDLQWMQ